MRKKIFFLTFVFVGLVILSGCQSSNSSDVEIQEGEELSIDEVKAELENPELEVSDEKITEIINGLESATEGDLVGQATGAYCFDTDPNNILGIKGVIAAGVGSKYRIYKDKCVGKSTLYTGGNYFRNFRAQTSLKQVYCKNQRRNSVSSIVSKCNNGCFKGRCLNGRGK